MKVLKLIIIILNFILLLNSFHFAIFAIIPFLKKIKINKITSKKKHKFLIIIAARNEEIVLGNLIDSINSQNYDRKLYKICVIPNNCIDGTKDIALSKDCMVLEPSFSPKSKGEVLNFAFDYFKDDNSFDSYVIFDADNILDKNFLSKINNKLNEGYKIVQGFRDTKNLYTNSVTGSYAIFYYLQSLFLYNARSRIKESSSLNGTGYVVLKEFIDKINYRAKTVTEDIELTCVCSINNEKIGYCREAIFYDEQVEYFNISMKQRKRWIQGSMQVLKQYKKDLFKKIKNKNTFQLIDMFQMLMLPIVQAISFILIIISYLFIIPFKYSLIGIIIGYIGEVTVAIFLIIHFKKNLKQLLGACLFFPIFHLSWIPIYIYSLFNTNNNWEEIKHTRNINIEEILEE